ncbi:hypothetical protein FSD31_25795 [Salmonella enterica]|nr:hypothetical protein [Salmonella enterica]EJK8888324.1 hypothetical protein [Salmonella enterica]
MGAQVNKLRDIRLIFFGSIIEVTGVFAGILLFMFCLPVVCYGFYRLVVVFGIDSLKPQLLMEFLNMTAELYIRVFPSMFVIAVILIFALSLFKVFSKVWRKSC